MRMRKVKEGHWKPLVIAVDSALFVLKRIGYQKGAVVKTFLVSLLGIVIPVGLVTLGLVCLKDGNTSRATGCVVAAVLLFALAIFLGTKFHIGPPKGHDF
jgi:hypothetical protein